MNGGVTLGKTFKAGYVLALSLLWVLAACAGTGADRAAESCVAAGGKWLVASRECEIAERAWCDAHAGRFNACASPCRNSGQQVCATVCVPICALPKK